MPKQKKEKKVTYEFTVVTHEAARLFFHEQTERFAWLIFPHFELVDMRAKVQLRRKGRLLAQVHADSYGTHAPLEGFFNDLPILGREPRLVAVWEIYPWQADLNEGDRLSVILTVTAAAKMTPRQWLLKETTKNGTMAAENALDIQAHHKIETIITDKDKRLKFHMEHSSVPLRERLDLAKQLAAP